VPAGVGIVVAAASGRGQWLAIVLAVLASTLLTMGVTAVVMQALSRARKEDGDA
jgi:putative effector of murein hydrolase LrgA (UPF0299 family)